MMSQAVRCLLLQLSDKSHYELRSTCISQFQVIFPGIWVFALILNIPLFLVVDTLKVKSNNFCVYVWPEAWMGKTYSWTLLVFQTLIPLPLMIAMYSRVVYTLWFKRNDHSQVKNQQMVSAQNPLRIYLSLLVMRFPNYRAILVIDRYYLLTRLNSPSIYLCSAQSL